MLRFELLGMRRNKRLSQDDPCTDGPDRLVVRVGMFRNLAARKCRSVRLEAVEREDPSPKRDNQTERQGKSGRLCQTKAEGGE